jgi:hypothetical protein
MFGMILYIIEFLVFQLQIVALALYQKHLPYLLSTILHGVLQLFVNKQEFILY